MLVFMTISFGGHFGRVALCNELLFSQGGEMIEVER